MKVAVITPYHGEDKDTLIRCCESVKLQKATHICVGDGVDSSIVDAYADQHIRLPVAHADYGDTPRLIGTISAYQQGFDAVCWLDADNWFEPDHVETLLGIANREVVSVVTATRNLRRPDGSLLGVCFESNGEDFCDTNCYLVMRDAVPLIAPSWGLKAKQNAVIGDRFVWKTVTEHYQRRGHCSRPTVNYESRIAVHYLARGEQPPPDARVIMRADGDTYYRSVPYVDVRS